MSYKTIIISLLTLASSQNLTQYFSSSMPSSEHGIFFEVNVTQFDIDEYINVELEQSGSNRLSFVVLEIGFEEGPPRRFPEEYYGRESSRLVDLEGARFGFTQYANMKKLKLQQTTLYVNIYNLNPLYRREDMFFDITVREGLRQRNCSTGEQGKCSSSCSKEKLGEYCNQDFTIIQPDAEKKKAISLQKNKQKHIVLQSMQFIWVIINLKSGHCQMYYLINDEKKAVPSYLNIDTEKSKKNFYIFDADNSYYSLPVYNQEEKDVTITFATYQNQAQIEISFEFQPYPGWAIVLIIVGSIVFFTCSVYGIFSVVQTCKNNIRHPPVIQEPVGINIQRNNDKLMPEAQFSLVKNRLNNFLLNNGTSQHLYPEQNMNKVKNQSTICVICYVEITGQQKVKIGYCGHIYHAKCLNQWFLKKKNCPNCRFNHEDRNLRSQHEKIVKHFPQAAEGGDYLLAAILNYQHVLL